MSEHDHENLHNALNLTALDIGPDVSDEAAQEQAKAFRTAIINHLDDRYAALSPALAALATLLSEGPQQVIQSALVDAYLAGCNDGAQDTIPQGITVVPEDVRPASLASVNVTPTARQLARATGMTAAHAQWHLDQGDVPQDVVSMLDALASGDPGALLQALAAQAAGPGEQFGFSAQEDEQGTWDSGTTWEQDDADCGDTTPSPATNYQG